MALILPPNATLDSNSPERHNAQAAVRAYDTVSFVIGRAFVGSASFMRTCRSASSVVDRATVAPSLLTAIVSLLSERILEELSRGTGAVEVDAAVEESCGSGFVIQKRSTK